MNDYMINNLNYEEQEYLLNQLETFREEKKRRAAIAAWEEHMKYKIRTCVDEIGAEEARRIARVLYGIATAYSKEKEEDE